MHPRSPPPLRREYEKDQPCRMMSPGTSTFQLPSLLQEGYKKIHNTTRRQPQTKKQPQRALDTVRAQRALDAIHAQIRTGRHASPPYTHPIPPSSISSTPAAASSGLRSYGCGPIPPTSTAGPAAAARPSSARQRSLQTRRRLVGRSSQAAPAARPQTARAAPDASQRTPPGTSAPWTSRWRACRTASRSRARRR